MEIEAVSLFLMRQNLTSARCALVYAQIELRQLRLAITLRRFNPGQPRVPAGSPGGGRWAGEDGGGAGAGAALTPVASRLEDGRLKIDLQEEEVRGGHALEEHFDKSDAELIGRIEREQWRFLFVEGGRKRAGTFFSLGEANEYVSATLEANRAIVNEVASGRTGNAFLTQRFGFVTGREAIVDPERRSMRLRPTYGVGVLIFRDKQSLLGFRVQTAFPRNDDQ